MNEFLFFKQKSFFKKTEGNGYSSIQNLDYFYNFFGCSRQKKTPQKILRWRVCVSVAKILTARHTNTHKDWCVFLDLDQELDL